jgi:hypothetical protein
MPMSRLRRLAAVAALIGFACAASPAAAASFCNQLVPAGSKMICAGFEPSWALELVCSGSGMTSRFIEAYSDPEITTAGSVTFLSEMPWRFRTSHGLSGTVRSTPGTCYDDSDRDSDYTLTIMSLPFIDSRPNPVCCRIQ